MVNIQELVQKTLFGILRLRLFSILFCEPNVIYGRMFYLLDGPDYSNSKKLIDVLLVDTQATGVTKPSAAMISAGYFGIIILLYSLIAKFSNLWSFCVKQIYKYLFANKPNKS